MRGRVLALAAVGMLAASPVEGQEPPDSVVVIEPVVVRVLRSTLGTGSPYPVSVVVGAELRRGTAVAFLEESLRSVPGVQIHNRFNLASGERVAVRGFGGRAQFGIRGIRVLVDGIPATLPDGQTALDHLDLASLGRVELLRGPGASLYGNAAGGVLLFQTLAAPPVPARVEARSVLGSHGLASHVASVSGTSGTTQYRLGVSRFGFDGFRRDPVADDGSTYDRARRTVVNGTLLVPFGQGHEVRFVLNGMDMDGANPGSISSSLLDEGDRQAYRFNVLQDTRERVRQGQAGATWTGAVGALDGEVSAWGIRREFEGLIPPSVVGFDRNAGGIRALFRGTADTGFGPLTLGGGLEVERQSDDRRNWDNDGGQRADLTLDQQERVRGAGLFFQARLEPSAKGAITAGLRYDRFRFEAQDRFLADGTDDSGARTLDAYSPSLGFVVEPLPRVELFGSVSTSFETPTTTELANRPSGAGGLNPDLDPTRAVTVEGGVRARLAASWSAEATLFRSDLKDELVPFEVPGAEGRTFFRNAGESRHRGWEATVEGRPTRGLWLRAAYTHVDARYVAYVVDGADYSDNRIPGLAPHRVDGRVVVERGAGFVEIRGLYQGDVPVDDSNGDSSPSYVLADVRLGLEGMSTWGLEISPFVAVANVLDRRYNSSVVVNAFGGRFFEPGPGRTIQLGLAVAFGG